MRKLPILLALLASPAALPAVAQVSCYDGYYSTDCTDRHGRRSSTYENSDGSTTTFYRDSEGNNHIMSCRKSGPWTSCY